ncbi:SsgA family sporulation/cell division regulator [Streptomyces sp. WMMC500]|uniref:SsgA family sporulation/cell division regulator n=1 Tax=Streptomyces sp. WMMC500 TaxID=3015154 RepID=UPI00248B68DB|nr:SsgA family sporulation/cell division regulator [Streptomyces sp. WMMC500]WBB62464.1 SsgA family sporulation/cell division regulator [Streptomyces sp. WMMC500]
MSEPTATVVRVVTVIVRVPGEPAGALSAELCYDAADPYAVRLSLGAPLDRPIDWVFARSLLDQGMHRPAGVGNVQVIPPHQCHPHAVAITVKSASTAPQITVPAVDVREFLRRSHALVPAGTESRYLDIDRALAALMNS